MAPTTETPALHVTIAANLEKLRADLGDARSMIDATLQSFTRARDAAPAVTTLANATKELGSQAQRSTTFTQDLHSALQKFDGTLSAVGLNINAGTRALAEIGQASTQTVGALGAVGAAGLVVGAAMAGWDFGRAIAGWLGTDAAIDRLIGTSQRLKDEVAGAQLDTIAHANALGAATTNYATAVEFLNQKHKEAADAQKAYEVGLKAITEAGQGFDRTLQTIDGSVVEAIKFYLAAGVSQKDLAGAYGLTAAQIRAVADARAHDIDTIKLWDQIHKTTFELAQQHEKQWHDESMRLLAERNRAVAAGVVENEKAEQDLIDFYAQKTLSSTDFQIMKIQEVARAQVAAFQGTIEQREVFNQRVMELATQQVEALKAKEHEVVANAAQAALDAANALASIIPDIGHGPTAPNGGGGPAPINVSPIVLPPVIHQSGIVTGQNTNLTARAGGGPVSAGAPYLVGELGPELFVPRASGSIVPNAAIAGGGGTQVIQLVVDGRVLASIVNDQLTRSMRQSRQFPAA
jgi:hypothetical protein